MSEHPGPSGQPSLANALALWRGGHPAQAMELCRRLLAHSPQNVEALNLLGACLLESGDPQGALPVLQQAARLAPRALAPRQNLAALHRSLGELGEALVWLREIIANNPDDLPARLAVGQISLQQGDFDQALAAYQAAQRAAPGSPDPAMGLALTHFGQGRRQEALHWARQALLMAPGRPDALRLAGACLLGLRNYSEAIATWQDLIRQEPEAGDAWCNLGMAYLENEQSTPAADALERSLQLDPSLAPAYINLAVLLERTHQTEKGEAIARAGLQRAPNNPDLTITLAKCLRRQGKPPEGHRLLTGFLVGAGDQLPPAVLSRVHFELAALEQKQRLWEPAFRSAKEANRLARQATPEIPAWQDSFRRELQTLESLFCSEWLAEWSALPPAPDPPPILLAGFPRSGTTLLGRMLDAHSNLCTLEEKDHLGMVFSQMAEELPGSFPAGLSGLSPERARAYRRHYLASLASQTPTIGGRQPRAIDKSPLDSAYAGPLFRLFPNARVIFLARHPADVCLSCFFQDFHPQPRSAAFSSFKDCMALYRQVARLWRVYLERLPLKHLVVRYEDLVEDFRPQLQRVLDFLGEPWEDQLLSYRERFNSGKLIGSISYHQVAQPLYQKAKFRYRNYLSELAPYRDEISSLCDFFNYPCL